MEDVQVTFTVTTDKGILLFHHLDELDSQMQDDLIDWGTFVIQTAARYLLSQHIGTEESAKVKISVKETARA